MDRNLYQPRKLQNQNWSRETPNFWADGANSQFYFHQPSTTSLRIALADFGIPYYNIQNILKMLNSQFFVQDNTSASATTTRLWSTQFPSVNYVWTTCRPIPVPYVGSFLLMNGSFTVKLLKTLRILVFGAYKTQERLINLNYTGTSNILVFGQAHGAVSPY